jgi:dienelactone hydrolase
MTISGVDRRRGPRKRLSGWLCLAALALAQIGGVQPAGAQTTRSLGGGGPDIPSVDPATVQTLPAARDYRPPDGIGFRATDFVSDNVRLTAQWLYPAAAEGKKLPTVIMAPGWGATAATLREDAVDLARAGYLVMLFDYRGWGESDGRVIRAAPQASEVRELRGYIDPWEQGEDWFNALSYAATAPMVDPARIGALGSDLAGGHVLETAARDERILTLVSVVTRADTRPYKPYEDPAKVIAAADAEAGRLAAGEPYPKERARAGERIGAPVGNKLVRWAPVEDAALVDAPALFVLAQKEELFSNSNNGQLACERVMGPRKLVMLPDIGHYGVYGPERPRAIAAAIDWFDKYLKPGEPPPGSELKLSERGTCNPDPRPPKGEEDPKGSGKGHKAPNASGRWN